jgi:glyoxylase-like metal-dependent hydrolase (beta-lactamase superfamily II)
VATVLLTHHHLDHSEGARRFAELVGCGVRALDPAYLRGAEGLAVDELPRRVVEIVYSDVDPVLWGAAELSVRAQIAYLQTR